MIKIGKVNSLSGHRSLTNYPPPKKIDRKSNPKWKEIVLENSEGKFKERLVDFFGGTLNGWEQHEISCYSRNSQTAIYPISLFSSFLSGFNVLSWPFRAVSS